MKMTVIVELEGRSFISLVIFEMKDAFQKVYSCISHFKHRAIVVTEIINSRNVELTGIEQCKHSSSGIHIEDTSLRIFVCSDIL